ncbi:MAG: ABC transporter permease [Firmicutes bacterium]|nr:ABC transporter permease [Bacillota bacterium]
MVRFAIRRLGEAVLALASIAAAVFFLFHTIPLSPAAAMLYPHDSPQAIAQLNAKLGLNLPIPVQFVLWIKETLMRGGVGQVIVRDLPPTLEMLFLGAVLAFLLATMTALVQIRYQGRVQDRVLGAFTGLLSVVPGFWLGTLLLFLFSMTLVWFPGYGYPPPGHGFFAWLHAEVLPSTTLALTAMGPWARQLRASLEESGATDYVRTARAKGVPEGRIRGRHMFRNSVLPLITLTGLSLPTMLNTVIALEIIYTVPGAGSALIGALTSLSFAGATTVALVLAMVTVMGSVVADLTYGLVDPRITYR